MLLSGCIFIAAGAGWLGTLGFVLEAVGSLALLFGTLRQHGCSGRAGWLLGAVGALGLALEAVGLRAVLILEAVGSLVVLSWPSWANAAEVRRGAAAAPASNIPRNRRRSGATCASTEFREAEISFVSI